MRKKMTAIILSTLLLSACASRQALFFSDPVGAQVFINGEAIGQTPCAYEYHLGTGGSRYQVRVEKTGYQPVQQVLMAEETDTAARNRWLVAGVIWSPLWLGTFFTKKLKDGYQFVLKQSAPQMTARVDSAPVQKYH